MKGGRGVEKEKAACTRLSCRFSEYKKKERMVSLQESGPRHALTPLHRVVGQERLPPCLAGKEEVALLAELWVRPVCRLSAIHLDSRLPFRVVLATINDASRDARRRQRELQSDACWEHCDWPRALKEKETKGSNENGRGSPGARGECDSLEEEGTVEQQTVTWPRKKKKKKSI